MRSLGELISLCPRDILAPADELVRSKVDCEAVPGTVDGTTSIRMASGDFLAIDSNSVDEAWESAALGLQLFCFKKSS